MTWTGGERRDIEKRVTVLEERDKMRAVAIDKMSYAITKMKDEMPDMIAKALGRELKPVFKDIADKEEAILSIAKDMQSRPTFSDCEIKSELYKDTNKRVYSLEEKLEPYLFAQNHPKIVALAILGLFYAMSHEWIGNFIIKLVN